MKKEDNMKILEEKTFQELKEIMEPAVCLYIERKKYNPGFYGLWDNPWKSDLYKNTINDDVYIKIIEIAKRESFKLTKNNVNFEELFSFIYEYDEWKYMLDWKAINDALDPKTEQQQIIELLEEIKALLKAFPKIPIKVVDEYGREIKE